MALIPSVACSVRSQLRDVGACRVLGMLMVVPKEESYMKESSRHVCWYLEQTERKERPNGIDAMLLYMRVLISAHRRQVIVLPCPALKKGVSIVAE